MGGGVRKGKLGISKLPGYISLFIGFLFFGIGLLGLTRSYPFRWLSLILRPEAATPENLLFFSIPFLGSMAFVLGGFYMAFIGGALLSGRRFNKWALTAFSPLVGLLASILLEIFLSISMAVFISAACICLIGIFMVIMMAKSSLKQGAEYEWGIKYRVIFALLLSSIGLFFSTVLITMLQRLLYRGVIIQ